jgi:hypothetical protein
MTGEQERELSMPAQGRQAEPSAQIVPRVPKMPLTLP